MIYRSCQGCAFAKAQCEHRDKLRSSLAGLGITSVKWKCGARKPLFTTGDAVWAFTVSSMTNADRYDDGEPYRDTYPGFIVDMLGTRALVYIAPGAPGEDYPDIKFEGDGFCKLPLARLKPRAADHEDICPACQRPASAGHAPAYSCNPLPELVA